MTAWQYCTSARAGCSFLATTSQATCVLCACKTGCSLFATCHGGLVAILARHYLRHAGGSARNYPRPLRSQQERRRKRAGCGSRRAKLFLLKDSYERGNESH
ncbi:hypothetical protein GOP47_0010549 [Adiantum capillus-veneris]|uniref:Uncharacterized protein n=1 Tax=Adiantum capillus-veneris TaxID=13818 RepID=A0A9D4ZGG4_ADICA|nr:hypothetical protein GOP47_0010549 [Adiantum capillus-veneris]